MKRSNFLFQKLEVIRNDQHGVKGGYSTTHALLSDRTHYANKEAREALCHQ
jgi:hypothetical protein